MSDPLLESLKKSYSTLREQQASTKIQAGRLYMGTVRKLLKDIKNDYPDQFNWREESGLLDGVFYISGDYVIIKAVIDHIKRALGG